MPDKIAVHFDFNGVPNRFEPPIVTAIFISVLSGIIAAVFIGASALTSMSATHMHQLINIPNRDYWLNEENRLKTVVRLCSSFERIGFWTMLLILFSQWELFRANQMVPPVLHSYLFYAIGIFVAYIFFDQMRLYWSFCRLPKNSEPQV